MHQAHRQWNRVDLVSGSWDAAVSLLAAAEQITVFILNISKIRLLTITRLLLSPPSDLNSTDRSSICPRQHALGKINQISTI